ncbi:MmcQ/YjbR family DNA-binding protein [Gelatiniphilus marinus]|uniref:MmcQ/YjbR family DNA-binding protein n=1 Tax=Gelatiniphilus marinus TaxID=1759464 RepID=A0ABW5JV87_9FLAO
MNIEQLREYCLNKKETSEGFPFNDNVLVFKVFGKMFVLTGLDSWEKSEAAINLKADPHYSEELRAEYSSIRPGYHMSKKHWNTLYIDEGQLESKLILKLIDHSYDMVVKTLPKKLQDTLK